MEVDQQSQPQPPHEHAETQKTVANDAIDLVGGPFAVIESDPGVFTSLTRRLGIPGLELVELYDIEPWAVDHLNPHGLIFCFLWKKDAHRPTDFDDPAAERVWFANQLSDDACATHAILNVVLNCPGIELGEELSAFRRETEAMSPVMRGLAVTNSRVIRPAHNSLARPSDIRSSISNLAITTFDAEKRKEKELKAKEKEDTKEKEKEVKPPPAKRAKTTTAKATAKGKGKEKAASTTSKAKAKSQPKGKLKRKGKEKKYDEDEDEEPVPDEEEPEEESEAEETEEEEAYHFIGYVPAHGKVWELDGLKSGPLEVGELPSPPPSASSSNRNQGWMDIARPALRMKMDKYGGSGNDGSNIRFSLLAIVDDTFRKAHDEFEFWRRERVTLERGISGSVKGEGWESMVDPTLIASAQSTFVPPSYPRPSRLTPPDSSTPRVNPEPASTSNDQPPAPSSPDAQLKPFAKDFASRRMDRDMQIMGMQRLPDAVQTLMKEWEKCVKEGMRAKVALEDEVVKGMRANTDHIKRTFDYDPFIREYITRLRQEGLLNPLLGRDDEGRKVRKAKATPAKTHGDEKK